MINIVKRDGRKEPLDINKIHSVIEWACEGLSGVSVSEVELASQIQFFNNMKSSQIHEIMIQAASNLINEETPNYQNVAGRLVAFQLRKQAYGKFEPDTLCDHYTKIRDLGYYDTEIGEAYTKEEFDYFDSKIDHKKDLDLVYVGIEQLRGKYLVKNRVNGEIYETPQMAFMLLAMTVFSRYKTNRNTYVLELYNSLSNFEISLPTPIMAGVRTPQRQFSSCVLIETGDSLDSINATTSAIVKYVSQKAGIGIGAGRMRALGSPIRNGDTSHTGVIPFYKLFQSAVNSCCLIPSTLVKIKDKTKIKTIELSQLKVGDRILSFADDKPTFKLVTDVWTTKVEKKDQRALRFENGQLIHCSVNHPIMVINENLEIEQRLPDEISFDDNVVLEDGTLTRVFAKLADNQSEEYIDITVEDTHTFFAGMTEDKFVLTHNSQGGVRKGSATLNYPLWHLEVEDLLVLKNNKGTEDNRVRGLDYCVQFNKVMYERLITGENITLFSPHDVPDLYDAFFINVDKFRTLYEKYERNSKIRKKTIPAIDLFSSFMQERKDTGRVYLMNVDHVNDHGAFIKELAPVTMTNLCLEICLTTTPLNDINDENGQIELCTLAAINKGKIKKPEDFKAPARILVRTLDALLDYQSYPVKAAQITTLNRRPLGIGLINYAYWLAKNGMNYSEPNLEEVHRFAEAYSYYLIKASADLAEELGACPLSHETLYSQGILPIDTYKKDVDNLTEPVYYLKDKWEELREQLKRTGIRNSTLMAIMPAETSAQVSNSTNGIEPPRALVSTKQSKEGVFSQVVPEINKLRNKYELLWDQESPLGYLKIVAVLQKFIDQSISTNTTYNPTFYENNELSMNELLQHLLFCYKYGIKTLYYFNTMDGAGEEKELSPSQVDDETCESCTI